MANKTKRVPTTEARLWGIVARTLVVMLFVTYSTLAWSQSAAQISGRVTDQSGAVMPGVEVTVTQTATGATRSAVTDETGNYALPNLPIGPYRLEAVTGFRTYVQTGVVLRVSTNPINAVLEVGQVAETVEFARRRAGGNAQHGAWPGHRQSARARVTAERAAGDRSDFPCGAVHSNCRSGLEFRCPELPDGRDFRSRRAVEWNYLHARWSVAQRSIQ